MSKRDVEIVSILIEQVNQLAEQMGIKTQVLDPAYVELLDSKSLRVVSEVESQVYRSTTLLLKVAYDVVVAKPELRPFVESVRGNYDILGKRQEEVAIEINKTVEPLNKKLDKINKQIEEFDHIDEETKSKIEGIYQAMVGSELENEYEQLLELSRNDKEIVKKVDELLKDIKTLGQWYDFETELQVKGEKYQYELPTVYLGKRMFELKQKLEKERVMLIEASFNK